MIEKQKARIFGIRDKLNNLDACIPVEYAARFVMAFLLGRARIFSDFAPFGAAFAAAAPCGTAGIVTTLGAIAGCLSTLSIAWGLKYIAAIILIRLIINIFSSTDAAGFTFFAPCVTFGVMLFIGAVYAIDSGWALVPTVLYAVETVLSAGCVYFYTIALSPWTEESTGKYGRVCHGVSLMLLMATLLISASGWVLFGVLSIGRCAAVVLVMFTVFRGRGGIGCSCAVILGAAMDLASGSVPFFTMSYGLCAAISGVFSNNSRLSFLLSYIVTNAICVMWTWESFAELSALYEVFAASVIFMLLPDTLLARAGTLLPSDSSGYGFLKAREYARDRVELTADAFKSLFDAVRTAYGEDTSDNVSLIFDRASNDVCRNCARCSKCWQQDYVDTVDIMNNLTPRLMKNGSIKSADFPARFLNDCQHPEALVCAINTETRTYLCRRQYRTRLRESRGAAFDQYNDISSVLRSLSDELGSDITVEPAMEKKLQKYLRGLGVDASTAVFRVRGGRLRAEIRGKGLGTLKKDKDYLNKLSALLGTRLCTSGERFDGDRIVLLEAEPLAASIGIASKRKSGESVSGDRGTYFRTDEGYLYVLLSDGMGSGEDAAKMSSAVTGILERFLKAGVSPEQSLKILSDLMLLKNDSDIESATVDMLCLNMFSGESKIFKYGAVPSYLKKGQSVKRISCGTFPVGLTSNFSGLRNVYATLKLVPDSYAVLVSDGVIPDGDDRWLKELIASFDGEEPRELSKAILESAISRTDSKDDMTVLAVRIEERQ